MNARKFVIQWSLLASLLVLVANRPASAQPPVNGETAIDRYVAKPDASYKWSVHKTVKQPGLTTYIVDMVSQTWRTKSDVDKPVWRHWLVITKPDQVVADKAFVMIGGGNSRSGVPEGAAKEIQQIALATGSVVAELRMIPNQSLIFHNDGVSRSEDDLIGYTWDQYLKTKDETWLARLPMVKSVVRAMDTIQELLGSKQGGEHKIDGFVVAGASKRGWTTWMTAAVDKRVVAIVPIVIDVLNVDPSMRHHYAAYGFWAPAVGDYERHKIMHRLDTPEHKALLREVDPYYFRDRFTMPKLILNAAGDQFFLPDSSQFYFDDLPGEKHLRYVANADHSLGGSDAIETIVAFYQGIISNTPRPKFSWTLPDDGSIRVQNNDKPDRVVLWQATNPKARDFRLESIGRAYKSSVLEDLGGGRYVADVAPPTEGWTAFFVELTYAKGRPVPLKLTTPVRVLPDTLPFDAKPIPTLEDE